MRRRRGSSNRAEPGRAVRAIAFALLAGLLAVALSVDAGATRSRPIGPSGKAGWTATHSISAPGESAFAPDVALNPDGRAVAVWYRIRAHRVRAMRAATRRPGHGFGPPKTIGQADQTSGNNPPSVPDVALDRRGDATAVWLRKDGQGNLRVVASFQPVGGEFGPVEALSQAGGPAFDPQIAFAPNGRAIAVWERLVAPGQTRVKAAVKPPGQRSFGDPVSISGAAFNSAFPKIGIGGGRAVVVWLAGPPPPAAGNHVIQAARLSSGGRVLPVQTVSQPDADADRPSLAVEPRSGKAAVAWTQFGATAQESEQSEVAFAPEGKVFRAPRQLPQRSGLVGLLPRPGFDDAGQATLLFLNSLPPPEVGNDLVRTAVTGDGSPFAARQVLASTAGSEDFFIKPALSVTGSGAAAALWVRGHPVRADDVQAAVRLAGERRFGDARPLTPSRAAGGADPSVAANDQIAIAVWTRLTGSQDSGVSSSVYRGLGPAR